jgi:hypothetical protein
VPDAIYRANEDDKRGSIYLQQRVEAIYNDLRLNGHLPPERGKEKLLATRRAVDRGWRDVSLMLAEAGDRQLAERVHRFVDRMPPPRTGNEMLMQEFLLRNTTRKIEPETRTR